MTALQLGIVSIALLIMVGVFVYFMFNRAKYIKEEDENKMELMRLISNMSDSEVERVMIAHNNNAFSDIGDEDES